MQNQKEAITLYSGFRRMMRYDFEMAEIAGGGMMWN